MSAEQAGSEIARLVDAAERGQPGAAADLTIEMYSELRRLACARLAPGHTLQPTALVHEAFIRLLGKESDAYANRRHFFYAAARAMQDIMVEQARRKARRRQLLAGAADDPEPETPIAAPDDMLALSESLEHLQAADPRKADLIRLRFFAGLTMSEAALVMGMSVPTLEREWRLARSILYVQLRREMPDP